MTSLQRTPALLKLERWQVLGRLGALTLLTGCDQDNVQHVLFAMSQWNDSLQAALFSGNRLAGGYSWLVGI